MEEDLPDHCWQVEYLLSILSKEGYAAMDCWVPTNAVDKNYAGKFFDYLESTCDDDISPWVRVYELEDIKKRTHGTIDALVDWIHQFVPHALISDESDGVVVFEVQYRLIHAIPDGDIGLLEELLKVSCDKCI